MQRDVVVARYHELKLRGSRFKHVKHGLVLNEVADFGDVAAMEEDVGLGEGEAVGVGFVSGRVWRGGVGVGDDEEAGADGLGGHDLEF